MTKKRWKPKFKRPKSNVSPNRQVDLNSIEYDQQEAVYMSTTLKRLDFLLGDAFKEPSFSEENLRMRTMVKAVDARFYAQRMEWHNLHNNVSDPRFSLKGFLGQSVELIGEIGYFRIHKKGGINVVRMCLLNPYITTAYRWIDYKRKKKPVISRQFNPFIPVGDHIWVDVNGMDTTIETNKDFVLAPGMFVSMTASVRTYQKRGRTQYGLAYPCINHLGNPVFREDGRVAYWVPTIYEELNNLNKVYYSAIQDKFIVNKDHRDKSLTGYYYEYFRDIEGNEGHELPMNAEAHACSMFLFKHDQYPAALHPLCRKMTEREIAKMMDFVIKTKEDKEFYAEVFGNG